LFAIRRLDLQTENHELRRALLDYPFTISDRDLALQQLQIRKTVPNGFVRCSYECTEVFHTNDLSIPSATRFVEFWPSLTTGSNIILRIYALKVDRVELLHNANIPDAVPPAKASVFDFRYQATNSRTKFNFASYTLNAGEQFKSDKDPKLLAEAKAWLKHGPSYDSYKSKRRTILVGMLIITLIFIGLILFRLKPDKRH